jgi:hypothetical protein
MNTRTFLRVLARPQFSCLKSVVLPRKAYFNSAAPKELAKRCPLLEELDVGWTDNTIAHISDQQLVELPRQFPHLTGISIDMWKATNTGIYSFVEKMADRLLHLCIKGETFVDEPVGYLSDSTLIQIGRVCPNLEGFAYWLSLRAYNVRHDSFSGAGVMALFRGCTKLKKLLLVDTRNVGLEAFVLIANTNGSSLSYLCVEGVPSLCSANADHVRSRLEEQIENVVITRHSKRCYDVPFRREIA